jgi:hypothetical protein
VRHSLRFQRREAERDDAMDWNVIVGIGTIISTLILLIGAVLALIELDHMARDRYVSVTNTLIQIWESPEFQRAQLWILYELQAESWEEFVHQHGGKYGEQALVTVGSYYNYVGTLTYEGLLPSPDPLLRSIGGYAIAVWEKIAPLVQQAREHEISTLFANYEWLVAAAFRAYKPMHPFSHDRGNLASLERLAGTVAGEGRPGPRILRRLRHHRDDQAT